MAKNRNGKSLGQRRSGGKVHRKHPAIIAPVERVATMMREAFLNIKVDTLQTGIKSGNILHNILKSAKNEAGNIKVGRGWSCNLTPKTIKKLTAEGVFA